MILARTVIDLAVEGLDLVCQHVEAKVGRWLYKGDTVDSFADPYVTRAPETDEALLMRYAMDRLVKRKAVSL